jgi:hypothetical protein
MQPALEDLINSLRNHLARLTAELEENKKVVAELRSTQSQPAYLSPPRPGHSVRDELVALRKEVERLGNEVHRLGGIVEQGLDTRRRARGERTIRMEQAEAASLAREVEREGADEEIRRIQTDVEKRQQRPQPAPGPSKLRQGMHQAASERPTVMPPSAVPPTCTTRQPTPPLPTDKAQTYGSPTPTQGSRSRARRSPPAEGPSSPFPSIRVEDEEDFFAALNNKEKAVSVDQPIPSTTRPAPATVGHHAQRQFALGSEDGLPPQTVLARVIGELEADFAHYKSYVARTRGWTQV